MFTWSNILNNSNLFFSFWKYWSKDWIALSPSPSIFFNSKTKFFDFISNNGPWDQLVSLNNIKLQRIFNNEKVILHNNLSFTPILVPHRDEYSETVGYIIEGNRKKALYIPDIDKWAKWNISITKMIKNVDYAFLDGTFFDEKEINNRDISEIPHPFIIESLELFNNLENIKKILNPYFTTKKKGTGLGLAIVNKIINDHNGSIKFVNLNDGAKVTVEFLKV